MKYLVLKSILVVLPVSGLVAKTDQQISPKTNVYFYRGLTCGLGNNIDKLTYSAGVRFMSKKDDCWTMQVSVYGTDKNGTTWLKHTAVIETGKGAKKEGKVLSDKTYGITNDPEYILEDTLAKLNGPIDSFFAAHPDVYMQVVTEKNNIIAKRK
jgi:hypothetical protein